MELEDPDRRGIKMQITRMATCDICYNKGMVISFIEKRTVLKICYVCLDKARKMIKNEAIKE